MSIEGQLGHVVGMVRLHTEKEGMSTSKSMHSKEKEGKKDKNKKERKRKRKRRVIKNQHEHRSQRVDSERIEKERKGVWMFAALRHQNVSPGGWIEEQFYKLLRMCRELSKAESSRRDGVRSRGKREVRRQVFAEKEKRPNLSHTSIDSVRQIDPRSFRAS